MTTASLAAKRIARKRSGRQVRSSCARSAGSSSRSHEVLAKALVAALDARELQHIDADAENHRRARCICARISRTAAASPSNTAWAMIAWPMFSSVISAIAATGPTLR